MNYLGIDISNNNGRFDLTNVKNNKCEFVYVKATEGATFKDPTMEYFLDQCKKLNLKVGAYHFLVSTSSPESQAENFYYKIKNYNWQLIPMLDIETNFNSLCDYTLRFIKRFKELCNMELGIYSYTGFISNLYSIKDQIKDMKFWEANYNHKPWYLENTFFNTRIGHQYSENGTIGNFKGDCNVFNEQCLLRKQGWNRSSNGKWWYCTDVENGCYYTADNGWKLIDGDYYLFDNEGYARTGWYQDDDKKWYYFEEANNGNMCKLVSGWKKIDDEWYYFNPNHDGSFGVMKTGWIKDGGKDYLLYSNGMMAHDVEEYGYSIDSNGVATKIDTVGLNKEGDE